MTVTLEQLLTDEALDSADADALAWHKRQPKKRDNRQAGKKVWRSIKRAKRARGPDETKGKKT